MKTIDEILNTEDYGELTHAEVLALIDLRVDQAKEEAHAEFNADVRDESAARVASYYESLGNALLGALDPDTIRASFKVVE